MALFSQSKASALLGPDDLVRRLEHLPSSAEVLPKVMEVLKDESSTMESVSALISMDQGVAAAVLQLSNSAYYSKGERSYHIGEAVSRVGMLKVYELVANAVASRLLLRDLASYGIPAEELWRSSFTCALGAEKLAIRLGLDGAAAYTTGLFHMAGMIAIDIWSTEQEKNIRFGMGDMPDESIPEEKRFLGFTNASVAASLLRQWSFHPAIVEPIRWQYLPKNAGAYTKLACVLHVAKWLRVAAHTEKETPRPPQPVPAVLEMIGLKPDHLDSLCVEVRGDYGNAVQLLDSLGEVTP